MGHYHDVRREIGGAYREVRTLVPGVAAAYAAMHEAAMAEGSLSKKVKELIALAIAISRECDGCIAAHAHGAVLHGATEQEVAEMIGVAILMNGGPGTVFGPRAWTAYKEFAASEATAGPGS